MPALQGHLSQPFVARYWSLVAEVLEQVFQIASKQQMHSLFEEITRLNPDEQIYFYHAEPLDVAADLAGLSNRDLSRYEQQYELIARKHHWTL